MEDLIKRKDTIEWFEPFANKGLVIPVDTIIQNIKDIPSAENKGEWTPCSERPPETDGDYLATLHLKWPDREYKTVEVVEFRNGGFDENLYIKVVAWMPLPEPWEGADDA